MTGGIDGCDDENQHARRDMGVWSRGRGQLHGRCVGHCVRWSGWSAGVCVQCSRSLDRSKCSVATSQLAFGMRAPARAAAAVADLLALIGLAPAERKRPPARRGRSRREGGKLDVGRRCAALACG